MSGTRDFSAGAAWIEGEFVPIAEARVPVTDWGFLRSDATYDVAHVWQGRFFRLDDHVARFLRGVEKLRMSLPVGEAGLRAILHRCVALAGLKDAYVEMICTRGQPPPGSRDPRLCRNAFFAFAVPFVWICDPEAQKTGLSLRVSDVVRIPPSSVDPTVKNYHWHDLTRGIFDACDHGDASAVLTDGHGNVTEGPGFNVFSVRGGALATPDAGVLEGITRRSAIELAREAGRRVEERPVSADELRRADEVFATSTAGGIMPVTRIDGAPVGAGVPGPVTMALHARYWAAHADPRWSEPVRTGT
ncbi:MAG: branched-chain amino acid transferase [Hyphomicrobiales bacterium]|nr:MAG: branched-chain amino acid transferase [Hyphomicrobiales bacterium]